MNRRRSRYGRRKLFESVLKHYPKLKGKQKRLHLFQLWQHMEDLPPPRRTAERPSA